REVGARQMIDALVRGLGDIGTHVRDAGKVHDGIHAADQRRPIERRGEVAEGRKRDTRWKALTAPIADGRADCVAGAVERGDKRAPDKARGAGHQNATLGSRHRLLRANVISSHATSAPPSASTARSTRGSGSIALTMASPASARV